MKWLEFKEYQINPAFITGIRIDKKYWTVTIYFGNNFAIETYENEKETEIAYQKIKDQIFYSAFTGKACC